MGLPRRNGIKEVGGEAAKQGGSKGRKPNVSLLSSSAAAAKSLQSCPTVCDPIDSSLPGCPVPGILQARTLEWGAIAFSALILWAPVIPHHQNPSRSQLARVPCDAAHRNQPLAGLRVWVGVQIEDNHLQICLKNCHPDGISG